MHLGGSPTPKAIGFASGLCTGLKGHLPACPPHQAAPALLAPPADEKVQSHNPGGHKPSSPGHPKPLGTSVPGTRNSAQVQCNPHGQRPRPAPQTLLLQAEALISPQVMSSQASLAPAWRLENPIHTEQCTAVGTTQAFFEEEKSGHPEGSGRRSADS